MLNNKENRYFDMLFHLGENGEEECNVSRPQTVYCVNSIYPLAL